MGKDSELLHAVKVEDVQTVQRIASKLKAKSKKGGSKKSPLNFQDEDGFSALHHAALNGNCAILAALLDTQFIAVDIKDNRDMRPLHYAAWQGKVDPVSLLLRSGADPNGPSLDRETPLHLASQYGSYKVVEILLQFRANPIMPNKVVKTPLDLSAEFGKLPVVQILLASNLCGAIISGPRPTMDNPSPISAHTPLHLAAKNGHVDVIRLLLDAGIDINRETSNGTALHEAALGGKSEVVKLLIMNGINVHRKNSHGQTALDIVNKFTPTRAASDIKQMLRDAVGGCQAVAIKDFIKIHDRSALSFKAGEVITILEKNANGKWKGCITKPPNTECIGYFPAECVEIVERPASTSSLTHPNAYGHGPPTPTESRVFRPIRPPVRPIPIRLYPYRQGQHSPSPAYITSAPHHQYHHQQQQYPQHQQASTPTMPAESFDQQQMQGPYKQQQNYYQHQPGSPTAGVPPHQLPQHGMNGSAGGYAVHDDRAYSHSHQQPDVHHRAHTMDASNGGPPHLMIPTGQRSSGGSPQHTPSPGSISPYGSGSPYQSGTPQNMSPRRVGIGGGQDGIWVRKGHLDNSGEESGVDVSSSTESMERKGSGSMHVPGGAPTIHMNVNSKPLGQSQNTRSFENMLDDRQSIQPGPRRPHSDSSTEIRVDPMRPPNVRPHYQGKDVDRIYEWLKRQHMGEYTNNFTKAGYDMPTISRMTPEDLTAIGITKPGHRKRVSAMISQLTEPDGIPNVRPPDVATWLKLLDLYQYYNTLITNGYNTMDNVMEITWEDLQDIGIIRLGHQKKLTLAIRRLLDLKRRDRQHRNTASQGGYPRDSSTGGSDAGSVSPHSSVDGFPPPPPPTMLAIGDRRPSPLQSPSPNGNLISVKPKTGLRSSQESLGSDISNKSSGSRGSRESKGSKGSREMYGPRQDMYGPRQILHPRPMEHGEASYVPTVTNLKVSPQERPPSGPPTPVMEQESQSSNQDMSFSTFKKPPPGHRPSLPILTGKPPTGQLGDSPTSHSGHYNSFQEGPKLPSQKSSESLDRLLEECTSHMQKRNSIEGGSSISSSGSGEIKLKRPKPPAPPKRSNSVITTKGDEQHVKTATIGRKKSMKQFREDMKLVRQEMQAAMATTPPPQAPMVKSSDIPDGYATIKRSPSRKASQPTYLRSNSHDESSGVPRRPNSGGAIPSGHELSASELDQMHQAATRPLNLGSFTPPSGQSTPNASSPGSFSPTSKPVVAHKPPPGALTLNIAHHQIPPRSASHQGLSSHQAPLHEECLQPLQLKETDITDPAPLDNVQANSNVSKQMESSLDSSATQVPHHSYVAQRKDIPPSPIRSLPSSAMAGAFKVPDIPPPKVPQSSGNYDRIEASLRENIRGRTPNFPSTSDTASISSGSTSVSTGSSDSGLPRSKGERPPSVEMILKRQSGGEDTPSSANPLEGIWRPRSRHFPSQTSEEIEDLTEEDGSKSVVKANVTFRELKSQFLENEKAPKGLISGRRPSKKLEDEYQQRRSFTDTDEHRQSPVCKNAPVSFDSLMEQVQSGRTESAATPVDVHTEPQPTTKKPAKAPVALPTHAKPAHQPLNNNTYVTGKATNDDCRYKDLPPPPSLSELPPPPAPQEYPPPPPAPDLPPPPPPLSPTSFPPAPQSEAPLPPPPANLMNSKPSHQTVKPMPPAPQMAPPSVPSIPMEPPRLPSMSSLPPPPAVPPVVYKKSPSKSKQPPQAPPKKKSPRQPVVSEGWDNSDTIKRKPVFKAPPTQHKPKPVAKPPSPTKPKPNKQRTAPVRSEDVDIYSQDLDMMDSLDDAEVVDSDSSETMETGLSGFENENTDTIKKQPVRLSPVKSKEESAADSVEAQLETLKMTMEMGRGCEVDLGGDQMVASGGRQRKGSRDSLGLGEATDKLESLLSSMVDDPLASFAASAEAAATSPSNEEKISFEGKESADLFNDIESMFTSLADDLDQMLL